ncbi:MAG: TMEM175 family protein [Flavobacteriales bacterium]|nr:TMEM175 family protein [Flavobacteriales bacterium]
MKVFKEKDFKWRGGNVSRLESIVDAVFAIAVTLLIVSRDIPSNFDEFMNVMLSFLGFIFTFTFLFMIWYAHYLFHRRFGLEDFKTIILNLVLIFFVLFYIYPLKFLSEVLFGMWLGTYDKFTGPVDMQSLMIIYGIGMFMIWLIFGVLYRHAYRFRNDLKLNSKEKQITIESMQIYFLMSIFGLISSIIALANYPILSGFFYFGIGPGIFLLLCFNKYVIKPEY